MTRTDDEKIALNDFAGAGVVPFSYADGSCGIRGVAGATALPSSITLAATFDRALAEEYGEVLGSEVLAAGHNVLLAPTMDIARDPRSGRIGENLGEDPLLAGEVGGRMGRGIQSRGALAVAKHFVANNMERLRTGSGSFGERTDAVDVRVGERALHEVYLAPFRRAITDYGVAGLLGSYNRLNGEYACQSPDLLKLPRREWGFEGVTIPDFLFAVRDAAAALHAGLDVAGLDESAGRTPEMVAAADDELIAGIGEHVRAASAQVGLREATGLVDEAGLATDRSLDLAQRVAVDGAVLLRNDGVLPLPPHTRVALIGAEDLHHRLVVGGAASVTLTPERIPGLIDSLESADLRVVAEASGCSNLPLPPLARTAGAEISVTRHDSSGDSVERLEFAVVQAPEEAGDASWSAVLTATLPALDGQAVVSVEFAGEVELFVDGVEVARGFREASPMIAGPQYVMQVLIPAAAGPRTIVAHYRSGPGIVVPGTQIAPHLALGVTELTPIIDAAVAAASASDVVVMLAGRVTGEAMDADELGLPAGQAQIIEALMQTGVPVVVVTHGGGPIEMPWREKVNAILHLGHAGERMAPAVAAMLSGVDEPGGRLPLTIPDGGSPIAVAAPDDEGRLAYDEGVDVGYRGYERGAREPAYWFGHGLGYADIDIVSAAADGGDVLVTLRCGAKRGGKAVVQLYGRSAKTDTLSLVGFEVARLEAGESLDVRIAVDAVVLARREAGAWVTPQGITEVQVGFSRGDLRQRVDVEVHG